MNLKEHYAAIRQKADEISEPYVVITSLKTSDGGQPGVLSLVRREAAARFIVMNRARLASDEEIAEYFAEDNRRRAEFEHQQNLSRMHIAVVKESDFPSPSPRRGRKSPTKATE